MFDLAPGFAGGSSSWVRLLRVTCVLRMHVCSYAGVSQPVILGGERG